MNHTTALHPAERPVDKCYLLDIPPEVRGIILKYLLILSPERTTYMSVSDGYIPLPEETVKTPLAIACSCQQLFWEVLPISYSKNSFTFWDLNACPLRRPYVKNITVSLDVMRGPGWRNRGSYIPSAAMKLLGECGPLNKLTVELVWADHDNFFRSVGVSKLRKIRGCKEFHVNRDQLIVSRTADLKEHLDEFESILRSEICTNPDSEAEKKERLEGIIAKKKQEGIDRKASLRHRA